MSSARAGGNGPLAGRTIVVTRARAQSGGMVAALEALGAEVLEAPTITIAPPESYGPLDDALRHLERYDWILVTSTNGVAHLLQRLAALGIDRGRLEGRRIAAVGTATARALSEAKLKADALPPEFNAASLAAMLSASDVRGLRFLLVRAQEGSEVLPTELRAAGATVDVVPAYRTLRAELDVEPIRRRLEEGTVCAITFASPSALRGFAWHFEPAELRRLLARTRIAVIGPVTAAAAVELGLEVALQPEVATVDGLVDALVRALGSAAAR